MPFVLSFLNIHTRRQVHQVIYERLFNWVGPDVMTRPPHIVKLKKVPKEKEDSSDDDKIEYEYIRPSEEAMAAYEAEWDQIFVDNNDKLPYTVRILPYRHYSFYSSKSSSPSIVPFDDELFVAKGKEIDLIIEWKATTYESIKSVVNKVVVDAEYSKWKKEKANKNENGMAASILR